MWAHSERRGRRGQFTHVPSSSLPLSLLAGWGEGGGLAWGMSTSGLLPPFPNLIVQSNEPNPLPGSFAFIENYSELNLRGGRICKWANLTGLGLTGHFEAPIWNLWKKGGGGRSSWVPGCIFYPTCLMFKRGGEQRLYFYPFLSRKKSDRMINCQSASCRIDQKSSASHNLVQRWLQFVILNLYWSHQPPASTFGRRQILQKLETLD